MTPHSAVGPEGPKLPVSDPEVLAEIATPALAAATSFQRGFIGNMTAYQNEWLAFLNTRLQENMTMPARISACRSLPQVQQVYADYWRRTLEQYSREYQHLGEIGNADGQSVSNTAAPTTDFVRGPNQQRSETSATRFQMDS
jgi:Phasin protein